MGDVPRLDTRKAHGERWVRVGDGVGGRVIGGAGAVGGGDRRGDGRRQVEALCGLGDLHCGYGGRDGGGESLRWCNMSQVLMSQI